MVITLAWNSIVTQMMLKPCSATKPISAYHIIDRTTCTHTHYYTPDQQCQENNAIMLNVYISLTNRCARWFQRGSKKNKHEWASHQRANTCVYQGENDNLHTFHFSCIVVIFITRTHTHIYQAHTHNMLTFMLYWRQNTKNAMERVKQFGLIWTPDDEACRTLSTSDTSFWALLSCEWLTCNYQIMTTQWLWTWEGMNG